MVAAVGVSPAGLAGVGAARRGAGRLRRGRRDKGEAPRGGESGTATAACGSELGRGGRAGSAREMPVRGDRGFPPRRELSGWLRVSFLPGPAASGCVGAGGFREAPHYPPATLWAVVSKGPPRGEDWEVGADGSWPLGVTWL